MESEPVANTARNSRASAVTEVVDIKAAEAAQCQRIAPARAAMLVQALRRRSCVVQAGLGGVTNAQGCVGKVGGRGALCAWVSDVGTDVAGDAVRYVERGPTEARGPGKATATVVMCSARDVRKARRAVGSAAMRRVRTECPRGRLPFGMGNTAGSGANSADNGIWRVEEGAMAWSAWCCEEGREG